MKRRTQADILSLIKPLAAEYYRSTGKPLGVTGEIAEYQAADKLKLELADARTPGYDAVRRINGKIEYIQIKGRYRPELPLYKGRVPKININAQFDSVVLVLLDAEYEPIEMWEASRNKVVQRIMAPGSKARNERKSLAISQFKSISKRVWPAS